MLKKLALISLFLLLPMYCFSKKTANSLIEAEIKLRDDYKIIVNNKLIKSDTPPVEYSNIIFIPIRFCAEYLDAKIKWDNKEKVATISLKNREVILKINELEAIVNKKKVVLLSPPFIYNNRTMIPLKFTATSLGAKVNEKEHGIEINTKDVGVASHSKDNEDKEDDRILIKPKKIKHKKGVGWTSWIGRNIYSKVRFVFVYEFRYNPLNKIIAPLVVILWCLTVVIYFIKIR